MSKDKLLVWKSHWKWLGWASKFRRDEVSGNYQGRVNSVSQVDGDSDMVSS